jgi:putative transposase
MARKPRFAPGGIVYHVMNRTWGGIELFEDDGDYEVFERVLAEALGRERTMRVCAYCLMPNHFHLVVWPTTDGQLSRFMQWLTMTHAQRWHAHRHTGGRGHLYQSRFKSFPIQADRHFLSVCRYVERNPLRARLVKRAERWRWGSLWLRGGENRPGPMTGLLADWPVTMPRDWVARVNQAQDDKELAALRKSSERGRPYGTDEWSVRIARRLQIESSLRPVGRPKKKTTGTSRKAKKKGL